VTIDRGAPTINAHHQPRARGVDPLTREFAQRVRAGGELLSTQIRILTSYREIGYGEAMVLLTSPESVPEPEHRALPLRLTAKEYADAERDAAFRRIRDFDQKMLLKYGPVPERPSPTTVERRAYTAARST